VVNVLGAGHYRLKYLKGVWLKTDYISSGIDVLSLINGFI
jgi:hypothetical protein